MARVSRFRQAINEAEAILPPYRTVEVGRHQRKIRPVPAINAGQGAPAIYDNTRFPHIAKVLCKEYGFTTIQLGKVFGVSSKTVESWLVKHKDFKDAVIEGRDEFDSVKVENALLKIALGYEYQEKSVKTVQCRSKDSEGNPIRVPAKEVTVTTKQFAPNAKAISFWLTNRQRDRWQMVSTVNANINSKTEHTERSLQLTADLSNMNSEQLRALRGMISSQKPEDAEILDSGQGTLLLEMLDKGREVIEEAQFEELSQYEED
jgi:hypothetical protein